MRHEILSMAGNSNNLESAHRYKRKMETSQTYIQTRGPWTTSLTWENSSNHNFMKSERFFIWTNLNPRHPMMSCAKFDWNWPNGCGDEDFLNFVNVLIVFLLFRNYIPLEKYWALHLNKLESSSYPRRHCAKFGWKWHGGFLNFVNVFSLFRNYLPL